MSKTILITHANCNDGLGSATVFGEWCKENDIRPEIYFTEDREELPEGCEVADNDVYIIDFSYPRDTLDKMRGEAKSLIVIDHHASAKDDLEGYEGDFVFDNTESGTSLAWLHFFPDLEMPLFVRQIKNRDLWTKEDGTDELYFALQNPSIDCAKLLSSNTETQKLIEKYRPVNEYHISLVNQLAKKAIKTTMTVEGQTYVINMVNNGSKALSSDVGNVLADQKGIFCSIVWRTQDMDNMFISLRSVGKNDVKSLAVLLGGGGHENASGCVLDNETFNKVFNMAKVS